MMLSTRPSYPMAAPQRLLPNPDLANHPWFRGLVSVIALGVLSSGHSLSCFTMKLVEVLITPGGT